MAIFRSAGAGHLVVVSSMSALRGLPKGSTAYAASKAGIASVAEGLRIELLDSPLVVTTLFPGYIESDMNDRVARRTPLMATTGTLASGSISVLVAVGVALIVGLPAELVVAVSVVVAVLAVAVSHRTVGSLVAGAGMRLARPYCPGEQVRLFVPTMCSVIDAEIVRVGPANTTLITSDGLVRVPNTRMLRGDPKHPGVAPRAA